MNHELFLGLLRSGFAAFLYCLVFVGPLLHGWVAQRGTIIFLAGVVVGGWVGGGWVGGCRGQVHFERG